MIYEKLIAFDQNFWFERWYITKKKKKDETNQKALTEACEYVDFY
jgi:hypothetical protein